MDNDFATGYALGADSNGNNSCNSGVGSWGEMIFAIIILAMFSGGDGFGNGGGIFGNRGGSGALTRADLCNEFNFNGLENSVRGVQQGLCDGFYAVNTSMLNGFHGVDNAVCNLGYTVQQGFNATQMAMMQNQNALQTQLANCCCENRAGQADIKYQMATDTCAITTAMANNTRDIIDNQNANYRGLMDWMVQRDLDALRTENQNLKLAASQANQNTYLTNAIVGQTEQLINRIAPTPVPSYQVPAPYPYCVPNGGYGYNGGCDCNAGCGSRCC